MRIVRRPISGLAKMTLKDSEPWRLLATTPFGGPVEAVELVEPLPVSTDAVADILASRMPAVRIFIPRVVDADRWYWIELTAEEADALASRLTKYAGSLRAETAAMGG